MQELISADLPLKDIDAGDVNFQVKQFIFLKQATSFQILVETASQHAHIIKLQIPLLMTAKASRKFNIFSLRLVDVGRFS